MYPSNNSHSNHNPTSFIDGQIIMHPTRPFFNNNDNIISPNSSTSLFQFPSSSHTPQYEDAVNDLTWQQLHDLFFIHQSSNLTSTGPALAETVIMEADPKRVNVSTRIKISSKKDRHSKINTAHGPRDRRMRLSLNVARKFFDLQDMLRFDKASKTVEWLLNRSNSAIQEISGSSAMRGSISLSSTTSECEGVSGIDHESITTKIKSSCSGNNKVKKKKKKANRKASFHKMARESRIIARERARKRTWEKKKMELLDDQYSNKSSCIISEEITMANYLKSFGSWSQFESGGKCDQESIINQYPKMIKNSCNFDQGIIEVEKLSSSHDHHQQILGTIEYAGNWNTSSTTSTFQQNSQISNEHHFGDFDHYCGKPWEACNNNV